MSTRWLVDLNSVQKTTPLCVRLFKHTVRRDRNIKCALHVLFDNVYFFPNRPNVTERQRRRSREKAINNISHCRTNMRRLKGVVNLTKDAHDWTENCTGTAALSERDVAKPAIGKTKVV